MNSQERVRAALRGEEPDRVPIVESVVDERVMVALFPDATAPGAFSEAIGLDAVGCGMSFGRHDETADSYRDEWGGS